MNKIEKRIIRILEELRDNNCIDASEFLKEFDISKSTLRRDFDRVAKYITYDAVYISSYSIDLDIDLKFYLQNIQQIASKIIDDENPISQLWLEELFSNINKLPKRSDIKYKEIQNFKNYELTYCITNEMATRNKRVIRLVKTFHKLAAHQDNKHKKYNEFKHRLSQNINLTDEIKNKYNNYLNFCNICSKKKTIGKIFSILKTEYMISPLDCKIDEVGYAPGNTYLTLQNFDNSVEVKSVLNGEQRIATNIYDSITSQLPNNLDNYKQKYNDGFILEQKKFKSNPEFEYSVIKQNFSRNIVDTNVSTISINFSLPKEELLAYISHIKDALYPKQQTKRIKTPEELTINQSYISNFTHLKTSDIANYFFVYDFVKVRISSLKNIYLEKKEESVEYSEDIERELMHTIFKDKLLQKQTKLDESMLISYYYTMLHISEYSDTHVGQHSDTLVKIFSR